jgi:farnesyl-diphosphate farnesyltransferase
MTSRSFYLTLRVLPEAVRLQVGLAYLLARTADTIADVGILSVSERLDALKKLRERIFAHNDVPLDFDGLAQRQCSEAEILLLEKSEYSLAVLNKIGDSDQKLIREVLGTIISGQELDLRRFAGASNGKINALKTAAELDDYTYRVAGCVGEFWTKICRSRLFPDVPLDEKQFIANGICFGKGLQLVNILRDLPADLKNGRCYLPMDKLEPLHLLPETLLSPTNEEKFLPLFHDYLDQAESYLAAGWRYTNTLPFGQFRLRLACAWPILIGLQTIEKLRAANVIQLQQRVKVSRREVRQIIFCSLVCCLFPKAWQKLYSPPGKAVDSRVKLA